MAPGASQGDGWLLLEGAGRRLLLTVLAVCVGLTAFYTALAAVATSDPRFFGAGGFDIPPGDLAYQLVLGLATALCGLRAVCVREGRLGWGLIAFGMTCWLSAELVYQFEGEQLAYPSFVDVLFLSEYPLVIAGLAVLLRGRLPVRDPRRWLDGLIAGTAGAALAIALLTPALQDLVVNDPAKTLTNLSYPILDIALASFTFAAVGAAGRELDRPLLLIFGAFAVAAVADGWYLYDEATSGYVTGNLTDPLWMVSALLSGLAAWTMPKPLGFKRLRATLLAVPVVLALAAVLTALIIDDPAPRLAIFVAMGSMVAVVCRLGLAIYDNERLLRLTHEEAHTDALTGLRNRRSLLEDLMALGIEVGYGGREALVAVYDLDGFKAYNDSFGHAAGDGLLRRLARNLAFAVGSNAGAYRLGGDEFCLVVRRQEGVRMEVVLAAASEALTEIGQGFTITSSVGAAYLPADTTDPSDALRIADTRMYANKGSRGALSGRQARDLLLQVLHERSPELSGHLGDVPELAGELARAAGLEGEDLDVVVRAAELHDVGKMAIPDDIVHRPGPLGPEEWALMRKHTVIGQRILSASPSLTEVGKLVRSTHERWDGTGYPDGLAGGEIPLGSRITAICDAYEAITAARPYDPARSSEEALSELLAGAGTQFDPVLVERFCELVRERSVLG